MESESNIVKKLREFSSQDKTPDMMYKDYIEKHRNGVKETFQNIMIPILREEGISPKIINNIKSLIDKHDDSKFSEEEWSAYRDHFYDPEKNPRSNSVVYDHAWNHHQKSNPHHWQYWVLINDVDEPQFQALDMPFEYIIELLCDWQSAGKHYGNTAYDWYQKQSHKMVLSPKTREIIEKYIVYLK